MSIPTPLIFDFTVIIDELKIHLGFPAKGYEEVLLRGIGVLHPIVYMQMEVNVFLDIFIEIGRPAEKIDMWRNR